MTGTIANSDIPLLCSLTIPEQFVLTAARLWVMPYRNAEASGTEWQDGFAAAGLGEVACMSFEILMRGIAAARRTNFDVRWPCCPRLGGDELCLLNCLSLLQHGATGDAILRLTAWLSPAAMRTVYNPVRSTIPWCVLPNCCAKPNSCCRCAAPSTRLSPMSWRISATSTAARY